MDTLESLREIYPYNAQTRTFNILARVDCFDDFFNHLDPSPAPSRDLSPELVDYLNQCSDEIPNRYSLEISLHVQNEVADGQREQECLASLQTFYKHEIFVAEAEIRHKREKSLKFLLVSLVCLASYIATGPWETAWFLLSLIREAVLIGGWLFMWEAVTVNFIELDTYYRLIKKFKRLIQAKFAFLYAQSDYNKSNSTRESEER